MPSTLAHTSLIQISIFYTHAIHNPVNLQWQYQAVGSGTPQGN